MFSYLSMIIFNTALFPLLFSFCLCTPAAMVSNTHPMEPEGGDGPRTRSAASDSTTIKGNRKLPLRRNNGKRGEQYDANIYDKPEDSDGAPTDTAEENNAGEGTHVKKMAHKELSDTAEENAGASTKKTVHKEPSSLAKSAKKLKKASVNNQHSPTLSESSSLQQSIPATSYSSNYVDVATGWRTVTSDYVWGDQPQYDKQGFRIEAGPYCQA